MFTIFVWCTKHIFSLSSCSFSSFYFLTVLCWFQEMSLNQNLLSSLAIFAPLLIISFNFFESILIIICYSLLQTLGYVAFCPSSLCDYYKYEFEICLLNHFRILILSFSFYHFTSWKHTHLFENYEIPIATLISSLLHIGRRFLGLEITSRFSGFK